MKMVKSPIVNTNAVKPQKQNRASKTAMDFDEVMRRVVRVKPEKPKKPAKRKRK
jgi:hypothetical protein